MMEILSLMEAKIEHMAFLTYRITQKTEYIMSRFLAELFDHFDKKKKYSKERCEKVLEMTRNVLFPFSLVTWQ